MKRTLYNVLGIEEKADAAAIEAAYRAKKAELAKSVDEEAQNELKLAEQAHTILSDPVQRAQYDKKMKLEKLMQTSAIQREEPKPDKGSGGGGLVLVILLLLGVVVYFGYQRYEAKKAAAAATTQQQPAAPGAAPQQ